jgi:hypothetical protein
MSKIIIDNFLRQDLVDAVNSDTIKSLMLSCEFEWRIKDDHFEHIFYDRYNVQSRFYQVIEPFVKKIEPKAIAKIHANLYTKNKIVSEYDSPYTNAIFFVNTNNGKTIVDGIEVESIENRIIFLNNDVTVKETNCTDEDCRVVIKLSYFL